MEPEEIPDTWEELVTIFASTPIYVKEAEVRMYGKIVHGVFVPCTQALPRGESDE